MSSKCLTVIKNRKTYWKACNTGNIMSFQELMQYIKVKNQYAQNRLSRTNWKQFTTSHLSVKWDIKVKERKLKKTYDLPRN